MAYKIKQPKLKEKKMKENSYIIKGKDVSKYPIYYLEDPEGNGLSPEETQKLWQYGVDSGIVWSLQGWYGRNAQALLDNGYIKYPKKRTRDYYGNPIPTQKEAKQGHFDEE
jgi:hypothetical protein